MGKRVVWSPAAASLALRRLFLMLGCCGEGRATTGRLHRLGGCWSRSAHCRPKEPDRDRLARGQAGAKRESPQWQGCESWQQWLSHAYPLDSGLQLSVLYAHSTPWHLPISRGFSPRKVARLPVLYSTLLRKSKICEFILWPH